MSFRVGFRSSTYGAAAPCPRARTTFFSPRASPPALAAPAPGPSGPGATLLLGADTTNVTSSAGLALMAPWRHDRAPERPVSRRWRVPLLCLHSRLARFCDRAGPNTMKSGGRSSIPPSNLFLFLIFYVFLSRRGVHGARSAAPEHYVAAMEEKQRRRLRVGRWGQRVRQSASPPAIWGRIDLCQSGGGHSAAPASQPASQQEGSFLGCGSTRAPGARTCIKINIWTAV